MARPATKEQIAKRRDEVAQLYFMSNATQTEIAQQLGWHENIIWNDIKWLRSQNVVYAKEKGNDVLMQIIERKLSLIRKANKRMIEAKGNPKEQRAESAHIKELDEELIQDLMYAGVIAKPTDRIVSANVNATLTAADIQKKVIEVLNGQTEEEK